MEWLGLLHSKATWPILLNTDEPVAKDQALFREMSHVWRQGDTLELAKSRLHQMRTIMAGQRALRGTVL